MIRALLVVIAGCAAALALPGVASAAKVRVIDAYDGREYTFDLAQHAGSEDVDAQYTIRSSPTQSQKRGVQGFSLAMVLDRATHTATGDRFDDISYSYVEIPRPGSGSVLLSKNQIRETSFPDGPAVVYPEGQGVGFLRPSSGADDANASDDFSFAGDLVIREGSGDAVEVSEIQASTTKPKVGQPVTFTAKVTGTAGQRLKLSWSFGDGSKSSGEQVTHTFRKKDCFRVTLDVTEDGSLQKTVGVYLYVETPEKKCDDRRRPGGSDPDDKRDKDKGSGGPGPGGGEDGTGEDGADGPGAADDGEREARRRRGPAETEPVTGDLLDDLAGSPAAPEAERPQEQPPVAPSAAADEGGFTVPGAALGLLATCALFGAGALRELERVGGGQLAARGIERLRAIAGRAWS